MKLILVAQLLLFATNAYSANYFNEAATNYENKNYLNAIKYLEKEIVFNPKSSDSYILLGKSHENLDNELTAIKYYDIAFTLVPHNTELNFLLGKISYNLGLMDEYVEYISNLEILCSVECDALNNLKALAN